MALVSDDKKNEYDVTRKINKDKYNGPFDWIRVDVSDDYTSNSIEECLQGYYVPMNLQDNRPPHGNLVLDDEKYERMNYQYKSISCKPNPQIIYYSQIGVGDFGACEELYKNEEVPYLLKSYKDFYVLGENVKLGHNDFWLWIEGDGQSTDMREFVQTIKKYNEKELIIIEKHTFLNGVDGYKFAGYGRFDKKQSICQKRLVFKRVTE